MSKEENQEFIQALSNIARNTLAAAREDAMVLYYELVEKHINRELYEMHGNGD